MNRFDLYNGDCIEVMRGMADNSVDSIVTDPPYELRFMGKEWDASGIANNPAMWAECLRVLKPGGHLLAFSGSRTYHRMTCAIEDAGFEVRDQIMWIYSSGFPKSLDVSKAIEKICVEDLPEEVENHDDRDALIEQWNGWGTALKPAHEPICVARKPLAKGNTVAGNVLEFGTGALNIAASRVPVDENADASQLRTMQRGKREPGDGWGMSTVAGDQPQVVKAEGRWPANVIHDGSPEVIAAFPQASGGKAPVRGTEPSNSTKAVFGQINRMASNAFHGHLPGSAARFFYCAKASRGDRNDGLVSSAQPAVKRQATMRQQEDADWSERNGNFHPTVKPTDLMLYLVRLITPPGGIVLDHFMGSGSTGKACMIEGFQFIGIDMTPEYVDIARARIQKSANDNKPAAAEQAAS